MTGTLRTREKADAQTLTACSVEIVRGHTVKVHSCAEHAKYRAVCRGCGMSPLLCWQHYLMVTSEQVVSCVRCKARGSFDMIFDTHPI